MGGGAAEASRPAAKEQPPEGEIHLIAPLTTQNGEVSGAISGLVIIALPENLISKKW